MPPTDADHELVQQARHDPEAFQALYHRYFRRVYGYVASRMGSTHDVEDVVSEIFLRLVKNLDQLRNHRHTSFAAWLFVIARHEIANYYRHSGRSETALPLDESLAAVDSQPDQIVGQGEDAAHLYRQVIALPERKREIITLKYYGGLRNHEIAAVLGIGEKTVSAYLSRALNDLQEKLRFQDRIFEDES